MKLTLKAPWRFLVTYRYLQFEFGGVWRRVDPDYDHYSTIRARGMPGLCAQGEARILLSVAASYLCYHPNRVHVVYDSGYAWTNGPMDLCSVRQHGHL